MAITIPSKNIYEINNQKVVDNEVDNIEVEARTVSPKNEYAIAVYQKDIMPPEGAIEQNRTVQDFNVDIAAEMGPSNPPRVIAALQVEPLYIHDNYGIKIPIKTGQNSIIKNLILGINETGTPNIGLRVFGIKKTSTASGFVGYAGDSASAQKSNYEIDWLGVTTSNTKEEEQEFTIRKEYKHEYTTTYGVFNTSLTTEVKVTIADDGTLDSVAEKQINENDIDYWQVPYIEALCGVKVTRLGGDFQNAIRHPDKADWKWAPISGTVEEYIPTIAELTFKGNTIGIDLQNETVKLGDGQHVYSFSGNEIMQTNSMQIIDSHYGITIGAKIKDEGDYSYFRYSHDLSSDDLVNGNIIVYQDEEATAVKLEVNGETIIAIKALKDGRFAELSGVLVTAMCTLKGNNIVASYGKVINDWKNGKEAATIRCAISDYYAETFRMIDARIGSIIDLTSVNKACVITVYFSEKIGKIITDYPIYIYALGGRYRCRYSTERPEFNNYSFIVDGASVDEISVDKTYQMDFTENRLVVDGTTDNMTIKIGEKVIPYIMDSYGKEKPMSFYYDKTPKEFLVIGNGIIADGEIMQELQLQEVTKEEKIF